MGILPAPPKKSGPWEQGGLKGLASLRSSPTWRLTPCGSSCLACSAVPRTGFPPGLGTWWAKNDEFRLILQVPWQRHLIDSMWAFTKWWSKSETKLNGCGMIAGTRYVPSTHLPYPPSPWSYAILQAFAWLLPNTAGIYFAMIPMISQTTWARSHLQCFWVTQMIGMSNRFGEEFRRSLPLESYRRWWLKLGLLLRQVALERPRLEPAGASSWQCWLTVVNCGYKQKHPITKGYSSLY